MKLTLEGPLETDGEIVYVGGMDLADCLRASLPHRDDPRRLGRSDYGPATVTVEADIDKVRPVVTPVRAA